MPLLLGGARGSSPFILHWSFPSERARVVVSVCPPLAFPLGRAQGLSLSWSSPGVVTAFPSRSPPFGKGQGIDTFFWRQSEGSHRLPSPGPSFWEGPRGCPGLWEEPEDHQCWPSTSLSLWKQPGDGCRSPHAHHSGKDQGVVTYSHPLALSLSKFGLL